LHGDSLYRETDTTGCGNTLDLRQPLAVQLVLDSLRMWVEEYHVDGFRFDLASALGRGQSGEFDQRGLFLSAIAQDPVISRVKLIAEPWDIGMGGYQLGFFPAPWAEWNDRYRDLVRDHWRNAPRPLGALARRITGNPDLFASSGRWPWASINFITAHDGFTMTDLTTYESKHNNANGERNADGTGDNRAWNHGVEGPTEDVAIDAARKRTVRNLLATLLLSHGTPMLLAGDEMGRTQRGNNNAYCHDSDLVWLDWENADDTLIAFTSTVIALRGRHPALHRSTWLTEDEAQWFAPDGTRMTIARWDDADTVGLTLLLNGHHDDDPQLLLLLHEGPERLAFVLPEGDWSLVLCTDPAWTEPTTSTPPELRRGVDFLDGRTVHLYERLERPDPVLHPGVNQSTPSGGRLT
jgi:isoamylase